MSNKNKKKVSKKAFTLVELLFAVAVSSILVILIVASVSFINTANGISVDNSSSMYDLRKVKDYIIEEKITSNKNYSYVDGCIYYKDDKVMENLYFDDLSFSFTKTNDVTRCTINYLVNEDNNEITFVVKIGD